MSSGHDPAGDVLACLTCRQTDDAARADQHLAPLQPLIELCTDRLILALVRFICSAYVTGRGAYWHAALSSAEEALGPADGPSFFARAAVLVSALRKERVRPFRFLPPACELASHDERDLLTFLQAARQPDPGLLRVRTASLTGQDSSPATHASVMALSGLQMRHLLLQATDDDADALDVPARHPTRLRLH
jgi:hypothetical protein